MLAAIAATDAICGLKLGLHSRGQGHVQALALLERVDVPSVLVTKLRRVLNEKDAAHYSPQLMTKSHARIVVDNARVLVEAAERL